MSIVGTLVGVAIIGAIGSAEVEQRACDKDPRWCKNTGQMLEFSPHNNYSNDYRELEEKPDYVDYTIDVNDLDRIYDLAEPGMVFMVTGERITKRFIIDSIKNICGQRKRVNTPIDLHGDLKKAGEQ